MENPLHQFEVKTLLPLSLGGYDISFTSSSLMMLLAVGLILGFLFLSLRRKALIPGHMQSASEMAYKFIGKMLSDNAGEEGKKYLPYVFSIFLFVLVGNLLGMIPYSFVYTGQLIVTFSLALFIFLLVTGIGIARHGFKFINFFIPEGMSFWMIPLIFPIEILSYLSRPISLSVRLFANMMAGHTMLALFAMFVVAGATAFSGFAASFGFLGSGLLIGLNSLLILFEFAIAFLQAYIFTVLTCIYLNDAINLH